MLLGRACTLLLPDDGFASLVDVAQHIVPIGKMSDRVPRIFAPIGACSVSSRCNCIVVVQYVDRWGVIQLGESVHSVRSGAWVVFGMFEFDVSLPSASNSSRARLFSYCSKSNSNYLERPTGPCAVYL